MKAPVEVSEQMMQKLRGKNEFTVLVTLKQDHLNSGVILSIHHSEHRYDQFSLRVIICLKYAVYFTYKLHTFSMLFILAYM